MGREDTPALVEPPRAEVKQQVVVDKMTGKVKRIGYCDFLADGSHKPQEETILVEGRDYEGAFHPDLHAREWYADPGGGFRAGPDVAPPAPPAPVLVSPGGRSFSLVVDDEGGLSTKPVK